MYLDSTLFPQLLRFFSFGSIIVTDIYMFVDNGADGLIIVYQDDGYWDWDYDSERLV